MIRAAIFDKDGTLVDFHRTWDAAVDVALRQTAPDVETLEAAAHALDFDLDQRTIRPCSVLVAESNDVILATVAPILDARALFTAAVEASIETVAPATGLPHALHALRTLNVRLAIATNDYESVVDAQLRTLGWADLFDQRVAADSGFGAKPEPGMILGVLDRLGIDCADAVMVGDTGHDIEAGSRAGATTVLVTNHTTPAQAVSDLADITVPDLASLVPALSEAGLLSGPND